jgi:ribosomal-protein-alanine N-acetyltransferase
VTHIIDDMILADIPQVVEVDRDSYPVSWPAGAYRRELGNHRHARYIVLRELPDGTGLPPSEHPPKRGWREILGWPPRADSVEVQSRGRILGYAGMWIISDEAHVTTIAVRPECRGLGSGALLLSSLMCLAYDLSVRWVTLEVRVSNDVAQHLYRRYGFRDAGFRKRYYSDNNEDALVMTTDDITLNAFRAGFAKLTRELGETLSARCTQDVKAAVLQFQETPPSVVAPPEPRWESTAHSSAE